MIIPTWVAFDRAVDTIASAVRERPLVGVLGIPRGGLPLAVALSHRLHIPMVTSPLDVHANDHGQDLLLVDDIRDSGITLRQWAERFPAAEKWVWFTREANPAGYRAVETVHDQGWVVFPWESPERAAKDQEQYNQRRAMN